MTTLSKRDCFSGTRHGNGIPGILNLIGFRYWTASLLPALMGTTLPFWFRPSGFSINWISAFEFLAATVLFHAGFSLWLACFRYRSEIERSRYLLIGVGCVCIIVTCLLGLHLNNGLPPVDSVFGGIFIVYGCTILFAGILYVLPPLSFYRRTGSEVVLCESMGMLPLLGAYLVQTGDLTRTVYLVAIPFIITTAIWVLTEELSAQPDDDRERRQTIVTLFGPRLSGRLILPALTLSLYLAILLVVFTASITPWTLAALFTTSLAWPILALSWRDYANPSRMLTASRIAFWLHLVTGGIMVVSPLVVLLQ